MMGANTSGGMRTLAMTSVGDLAPRVHARVEASAPIWQVVAEMKAKGRGAVLVEADGKLVGIFTERDLMTRLDHSDIMWSHVIVEQVMTPHPTVVRPDDSLAEALRLLTQGRRRHLPVVDAQGHTLGLLSVRDILTFVASKFPEDMINLPPDPDHER